jgi:hypothetical protein
MKALRSLGLIDDTSGPVQEQVEKSAAETALHFTRQQYDSVPFLSFSRQRRYSTLAQLGTKIADMGSNGNDHVYKLTFLRLTALVNGIYEHAKKNPSISDIHIDSGSLSGNTDLLIPDFSFAGTIPATSLLEPVLRGASLSNADLKNSSRLVRAKVPTLRRCSDCKTFGHRASSRSCPKQVEKNAKKT